MRAYILLGLLLMNPSVHGEDGQVAGEQMVPVAGEVTVRAAVEKEVDAVREVFPDAYTQFLNVGFEYHESGEIYPDRVEFYVPSRSFSGPLDEEDLQARARRIADRVGISGSCANADVGPSEQFSWSAWPDKTVRKVTVHFLFLC